MELLRLFKDINEYNAYKQNEPVTERPTTKQPILEQTQISPIKSKNVYAKDFMQRELTEWGRIELILDRFLIGEITPDKMHTYLKEKMDFFNKCKDYHILKREYEEFNLASIFDQIFDVLNTEISKLEVKGI